MIFPVFLLALALVQAPAQPVPDKMVCWDNVMVTRDFISWTAWDCRRSNREESLGPKITYKTLHGTGVVTIVGPKRIPRKYQIPDFVAQELFNDLSRALDILGAIHHHSHRPFTQERTNAPVKI